MSEFTVVNKNIKNCKVNNSNNMGDDYRLLNTLHTVIVTYDYLLKLINTSLKDVLKSLEEFAIQNNAKTVNIPLHGKIIIVGKSDFAALKILYDFLKIYDNNNQM